MSFRRKVFVSEKIAFYISGRELQVQALVSVHGAKYVFEESEVPEAILKALGSEVEARYRGMAVRCRVVRETNPAGTIFSFRFLNPSTLLTQQIGIDIRERGIPSPWLRSLPRLVPEAARHLPSPSLAMVNHQGGMVFLAVKNFTLGGLLLESDGPEMNGIAMGSILNFDLVTNGGEKLADFQAMVCHVCAERGDGAAKTLFGVRFLFMSGLSENKYKTIVREHCLGLRSDLDGRIDD